MNPKRQLEKRYSPYRPKPRGNTEFDSFSE